MRKFNKFFAYPLLAVSLLTVTAIGFNSSASAQSPAKKDSVIINGKTLSVKYAAPSVRGRQIYGEGGLLSKERHYPVWRAGANSATILHTDADIQIGDLQVPKGDYSLFVDLSNPEQWMLVVNKQTGQWGLNYNKDNDLGKVKMDMSKPSALVETLKYSLTDQGGNNAKLLLEWENQSASVPIMVK